MPTISLPEADKAYAVSFAVPSDVEGLFMIYGRQSCAIQKAGGRRRRGSGQQKIRWSGKPSLYSTTCLFHPGKSFHVKSGILQECWLKVAGYLQTELWRLQDWRRRRSHRCCFGGDYNGVSKTSHVKDKLIEITSQRNTLLLHRMLLGRLSDKGRKLRDRYALGQRLQAERHQIPL